MKLYNLGLFVFRRDLRLADNTAFIAASKECSTVLPIFIFDPRQVTTKNNFRSQNAIQFMIASLKELATEIKKNNGKLYYFSGIQEEVIEKLIKELPLEAIYINQDYTPFSLKRDKEIEKSCYKAEISFHAFHDVLLNEPSSLLSQAQTPYSRFTPYLKKAKKNPVEKPQKGIKCSFYKKALKSEESSAIFKKVLKTSNSEIYKSGGRKEALKILRNLKKFNNYAEERDFPAIETTGLSAHLKFGTCSIRELYHQIKKQLGENHPLISQLYWHDFFTMVAYYSPFVYGAPFYEKFKNLWWSDDKKLFNAWCTGKTGFPIVDAGMRQLNTTGFMHNRARMIVGSFLTKDLHIDWQWGEKYFAKTLVDYDPAINNGNWQWVASTGCDAQPYFRIFNPWLQQKKFDPECKYIKTWVPELKNIPAEGIHTIYRKALDIKNYPNPIVDHNYESKRAKKIYKKAAQS